MNSLTISSVLLIILQSVISALANVKITPIAVDNIKSSLKSDLKVEEARYRDPVVPEYYGNSYDRNRQNFVTGSSYGGSMTNFDRNGYNSGYDRYGSSDRFGSGDRYGSQWNRDRIGSSYGSNPLGPVENKLNYMPGGVYNPGMPNSYGMSNSYGGSFGGYGNRPYEGGSINGPYPGAPGAGVAGLFNQDMDGKSSLILPLAGAALLGIAAYALVASPGMAMGPMLGKRRKRSLFDEKLEQHLVYRAHQKQMKKV